MTEPRQRCQAVTQHGNPCKNYVQTGSSYCHVHHTRAASVERTTRPMNRRYFMRDEFPYKGKKVKIKMSKNGKTATLKIDGKEFEAKLHQMGKPEDNYIKLWMCPNAYVMTESPELMAKHLIDYWYQYA